MNKIFPHKQKLIDLFGGCSNAYLLDYGCGHGDFIELLLRSVQKPKLIFAVDSNEAMIKNIQMSFVSAIKEGAVVTRLASDPSELQGNKFDKIICHNVLECVDNKVEFINGFKKLLNKDGVLILSHHDFDSAIYNSIHQKLSRDLVHHFSDTKQKWQHYSDGQMGRKIPGLISRSTFRGNAKYETWRIVDTEFTAGMYGFLMADMIMEAGKGIFNDENMLEWRHDLLQKSELGEYYFAIDLVVSICVG